MQPNKLSQWSKGIVCRRIKYGGKLFMVDGGHIVLGKFIDDCSTWRVDGYINCQSWSDMHLKIKPWPVNNGSIVEVFIPKINC